jgi:hypothetical protein
LRFQFLNLFMHRPHAAMQVVKLMADFPAGVQPEGDGDDDRQERSSQGTIRVGGFCDDPDASEDNNRNEQAQAADAEDLPHAA